MKRYLPLLLITALLLAQASESPAAIVIAAYGDSTTAGVTSSGGRSIISKENEISYLQHGVAAEIWSDGADRKPWLTRRAGH